MALWLLVAHQRAQLTTPPILGTKNFQLFRSQQVLPSQLLLIMERTTSICMHQILQAVDHRVQPSLLQ